MNQRVFGTISRPLTTLILLAFVAVGCSDSEEVIQRSGEQPTAASELSGDTGKADGQRYSIKDYFKSSSLIPLDDLTDRLSHMATDELNDALGAVPYTNISLSNTMLFAVEPGSEGGSTIHGLTGLVEGLTAQYGTTELVTQINQNRKQFLESTPFRFYAENEFEVALGGDASFSTDAGDFDVRLGFSPNVLVEARTVFAHEDSNISAILTGPLSSAKALRGFIIPRDTDDLRNLLPGESVGLKGQGILGFNVGANLPIFSVSPVDHLVLNARFHLGARARTSGTIDVQFIRGNGSELTVDIGVSKVTDQQFTAAIESGYGLEGFPALLEVGIGNQTFALGDIAETLIEKRLARTGLLDFGARSSRRTEDVRHTVHRFQIDLDRSSVEMDQALKQVVAGDARLMQALADRQNTGVKALVSLERNLRTKNSHLGAHLASLRFFTERTEREGKVTVHSGQSVTEILFNELQDDRGRFWTDWGFRRLVVTAQSWENGIYQGARSNLRLAVSESDAFTDRDQVLDHVDAALLSVMSFESAYSDLTRHFEELQHRVDMHCDKCGSNDNAGCRNRYRRCVAELITESEVAEWRSELESRSDEATSSLDVVGYSTQFENAQSIADRLLDLKLNLSSVKELPVALADVTGRTSILSDYRISQDGLDTLFRKVTPVEFDIRLRQVLTTIISKRSRDYDRKYERALDWIDGEADRVADMVSVYEEARNRYLALDEATAINVEGRPIGNGAFIVSGREVFDDRRNQSPDDDDAFETITEPVILSIAQQKASVASELVEALVDRGKELNFLQSLLRLVTLGLANPRSFEGHHLVAYTLLSLVEPEHREWLIAMDFEEEAFTDVHMYSRGSAETGFVGVGEFDLDELLLR